MMTPEAVCVEHSERLARIETELLQIQALITQISQKMDTRFVTHTEFRPVRQLVYGFVTLILVGVASAIIALVIKGGS